MVTLWWAWCIYKPSVLQWDTVDPSTAPLAQSLARSPAAFPASPALKSCSRCFLGILCILSYRAAAQSCSSCGTMMTLLDHTQWGTVLYAKALLSPTMLCAEQDRHGREAAAADHHVARSRWQAAHQHCHRPEGWAIPVHAWC